MKIKSLAPFTLLAAAFLSSCASYKASPLYDLSPDLVRTSSRENEGVSIAAKAFTRQDCERYLDRDVIGQGYQPIQLYIQNDSDKNYIFSLDRVGLPIARPEEVAETVHTSTVGRVVGYSVGALFLWPLVIPAVVDGIKSSEANTALNSDFEAKAARDRIVFSHSRQNTLLFVPTSAYQNAFTVTLIDQESQKPNEFHLVVLNKNS